MRRFCKHFLAILGVAWGPFILPLLPEAARAANPTELAELLKKSGSPGTDAAKVEALLDSLREAERRNAERRSPAEPAATQTPDSPGAAPAAAEDSEALPGAVAADAADATGDEASAEPEAPKRVSRAGCMYSGARLIWEKVPGSCER
jgi:hypothetical protein